MQIDINSNNSHVSTHSDFLQQAKLHQIKICKVLYANIISHQKYRKYTNITIINSSESHHASISLYYSPKRSRQCRSPN
jgi:hypothetical protein